MLSYAILDFAIKHWMGLISSSLVVVFILKIFASMGLSPRPNFQKTDKVTNEPSAATTTNKNKTVSSSTTKSSEASTSHKTKTNSTGSSSRSKPPPVPVTLRNSEYNPPLTGTWGEGLYFNSDEESATKSWSYYSLCKTIWERDDALLEHFREQDWNDVVYQQDEYFNECRYYYNWPDMPLSRIVFPIMSRQQSPSAPPSRPQPAPLLAQQPRQLQQTNTIYPCCGMMAMASCGQPLLQQLPQPRRPMMMSTRTTPAPAAIVMDPRLDEEISTIFRRSSNPRQSSSSSGNYNAIASSSSSAPAAVAAPVTVTNVRRLSYEPVSDQSSSVSLDSISSSSFPSSATEIDLEEDKRL